MAEGTDIRPHMKVIGSDGLHIGTVDHVDGDRIKMTRQDSNDGAHHYVPLANVTRVDSEVHVSTTAAALGLIAAAGVTGAVADHGEAPFPPVQNRQVPGARPRGNYYLPWIVGLVGLILLVLLFRGCVNQTGAATTTATTTTRTEAIGTAPLPLEDVTLPGGQKVSLERSGLNYELQRYLASVEAAPRTFTFDKLNFDTGSAAIRPVDQANVDALAQILLVYPKARVGIVGYTDARGKGADNAQLGIERAYAVATELAVKGVDRERLAITSGGEGNPDSTNATAQGQFENRRTELVVTAK